MYGFDYNSSGSEQNCVSPMLFNVMVYQVGDIYGVPKLKDRAKKKFKDIIETGWRTTSLPLLRRCIQVLRRRIEAFGTCLWERRSNISRPWREMMILCRSSRTLQALLVTWYYTQVQVVIRSPHTGALVAINSGNLGSLGRPTTTIALFVHMSQGMSSIRERFGKPICRGFTSS